MFPCWSRSGAPLPGRPHGAYSPDLGGPDGSRARGSGGVGGNVEKECYHCITNKGSSFINTPDSFTIPIGGERATKGCLNG